MFNQSWITNWLADICDITISVDLRDKDDCFLEMRNYDAIVYFHPPLLLFLWVFVLIERSRLWNFWKSRRQNVEIKINMKNWYIPSAVENFFFYSFIFSLTKLFRWIKKLLEVQCPETGILKVNKLRDFSCWWLRWGQKCMNHFCGCFNQFCGY